MQGETELLFWHPGPAVSARVPVCVEVVGSVSCVSSPQLSVYMFVSSSTTDVPPFIVLNAPESIVVMKLLILILFRLIFFGFIFMLFNRLKSA